MGQYCSCRSYKLIGCRFNTLDAYLARGAMMVTNAAGPRFSPPEKFRGIAKPKPVKRNHYHHFVDACLGGEKTESFFEQTGPMTESILLGTVAARVPNTKLDWDAKNLRAPNCPEADKYIRKTYRKGWVLNG